VLEIKPTTKFKKDIKKIQNDKKKMLELKWVITELANERTLPDKYKVHSLIGNYTRSL
jgi:mRNA interferase YafQ